MKAVEVLELARNYARQQNYDVDKYDANATEEGTRWRIDFHSKERKPVPGDFFSVYVDCQTKSVVRQVPGK
jgi:hypothetical protein